MVAHLDNRQVDRKVGLRAARMAVCWGCPTVVLSEIRTVDPWAAKRDDLMGQ